MKKLKHFKVLDEGTVILITPLTKKARARIDENVYSEPWQWLGNGLAVDHDLADDLLNGITEAGLI